MVSAVPRPRPGHPGLAQFVSALASQALSMQLGLWGRLTLRSGTARDVARHRHPLSQKLCLML